MKFKLIFVIFNAIVVFSFLFIVLLPIIMLGWEYAAPFWQNSWYLLVLFVVILGGLDFYFARNWKLFTLLEKQDWDEIQAYLENRIFQEDKINDQGLQILLTTYVQKNQPEQIIRLANLLREKHAKIFTRNLLSLSIGYLIEDDYEALRDFYAEHISPDSLLAQGWADWHWAFASLRLEDVESGKTKLLQISRKSKDELLTALSLYMLIGIMGDSEIDESGRKFLAKFREKYSPALWQKKIESRRERLHILTLSAVLRQAGEWILKEYNPGAVAEAQDFTAGESVPQESGDE